MSALWTSDEIAAATGGVASAPFEIDAVTFDSREVEPGSLFIALKGEATDGHRFIDGAVSKGAAGLLVSEGAAAPNVRVADTMAALEALGRASRARTDATIIGVTGSVGKTGTKEALAACLARANKGPVHRSVKSYNNHTGVPLSLARMPRESRFAVLEMGMNHAGEIRALTAMVRPHVALITAIAPAHIENLGSLEGIADAKAEIFEGLEPGGTAIIPFDSPYCARLAEAAKASGAAHIITFGRGEGADVHPIELMPVADGTQIMAQLPGVQLSFTLAYEGDHWISNAMGILAAVQAAGGDLAAAGLALGSMEGLAGRGARHMIKTPDGGTALLIDESYNANPASMAATFAVLAKAEADRRVVILGEMRELGPTGPELHASLAEPLLQAGVELALLVGEGMKPLADALAGSIQTLHLPDASSAQLAIQDQLLAGDALLIKGSNAVGLGRVVDALKQDSL
jgi:UDP-N-acetylmuramoyl-tripeptide--D-alanyl-D-alanine ligase